MNCLLLLQPLTDCTHLSNKHQPLLGWAVQSQPCCTLLCHSTCRLLLLLFRLSASQNSAGARWVDCQVPGPITHCPVLPWHCLHAEPAQRLPGAVLPCSFTGVPQCSCMPTPSVYSPRHALYLHFVPSGAQSLGSACFRLCRWPAWASHMGMCDTRGCMLRASVLRVWSVLHVLTGQHPESMLCRKLTCTVEV